MKFIHAADLHLGSTLSVAPFGPDVSSGLSQTPTVRDVDPSLVLWESFDRLIDLCLSEQVCFLLLAGDTFDNKRIGISDQARFRQGMERLHQHEIPAFLIHGNHDPLCDETQFLSRIAGLSVFAADQAETKELPDLGVAIHGQSFTPGPVEQNLVTAYPNAISGAFNIGLLHTSLVGEGAHAAYAPCTQGDLLAKSYDYWALGHIHKRQHLRSEDQADIVFAGNIQGRNVRETGDKGVTLVEVEEGTAEDVRFVSLAGFLFDQLSIDLTECHDQEQALARIVVALDAFDCAMPTCLRLVLTAKPLLLAELKVNRLNLLDQVRLESSAVGQGRLQVKDLRFVEQQDAQAVSLPFDLDVKLQPELFESLSDRMAKSGLAMPVVEDKEVEDFLKARLAAQAQRQT